MPIDETEKQEFSYLQRLSDVMESLEIPIAELFWNENKPGLGLKPQKYAVYYITGENANLSSDDETEVENVSITVSFYIKGPFRKIKQRACREFRAAGFFVSLGYETFEKDTEYNHFDVELNDYF